MSQTTLQPADAPPADVRPSRGSVVQSIASAAGAFWRAPWPVRLLSVVLVVLYAPVVAAAARVWVTDDKQAHGVFIFPVVLFLLWVLRDAIRQAKPSPSAWGLALLFFGLALETFSYLLGIKWFPMLSLIPVLAGVILALHGRALLKVVAFPVLFLFFAAPLPDAISLPVSAQIQRASTDSAVFTMTTMGFPLVQTGNRIDTPTCSVEVAEVCSGFKKLTALIAFALLYGFMFPIGLGKRLLLLASAYPIALFANVIRICALTWIASTWGENALHAAHDWAELSVLVVSFGLFILVGKAVGCRSLRFSV
ncbi:MAG: exosortase/archaeosortase family protein [Armatimonadetes bacterium]|nr:exosortase/archaeosortase family protein [Armatimonadota bacterium]